MMLGVRGVEFECAVEVRRSFYRSAHREKAGKRPGQEEIRGPGPFSGNALVL